MHLVNCLDFGLWTGCQLFASFETERFIMPEDYLPGIGAGPKLKVRINRFHGVCKWTWNVNGGDDDEVCGICQSAFEGTAPGVSYPGDECPVVFGKCSHAFHLICLQKWISGSRNNCPICRREWEFGENKASTNTDDIN